MEILPIRLKPNLLSPNMNLRSYSSGINKNIDLSKDSEKILANNKQSCKNKYINLIIKRLILDIYLIPKLIYFNKSW